MERVSQMKKKIYFFNIYSSQAITHDYCQASGQCPASAQGSRFLYIRWKTLLFCDQSYKLKHFITYKGSAKSV